jgi:hypothetical protein
MFSTVMPKYGLVVEYDLEGNIVRSWHDPTGKVVNSNTNVVLYHNKLYVGSFYHDHISVLDYF